MSMTTFGSRLRGWVAASAALMWAVAVALGQTGDTDSDGDGLTDNQELAIASSDPALATLNPANWDSDGDGMDDGWEYQHRFTPPGLDAAEGMNPCLNDRTLDYDGDGLSAWQEYCGVDGEPRMVSGGVVDGAVVGLLNSSDDLNPLDIDTDYDLLIDSFEAAWYDPEAGIDPHAGVALAIPSEGDVDSSIAEADPDHDGLSNYREQCLLMEFRQGYVNESKWAWDARVPFPHYVYTYNGKAIRVCEMIDPGAHLTLGLDMNLSMVVFTNRFQLRNHEWTDPTDGTGYLYTDEPSASPNPGPDLSVPPDGIPDAPNPGHDTDGDWLPDGWEVEFHLDPRDDGTGNSDDNGPFGDPDDDNLCNYDEYTGQDGLRSTTREYVNGTGDETNPNEHDWRPDSTYHWRWYPTYAATGPEQTDPRIGKGISRAETLGAALPTASVGVDIGEDSDDDGLTDWEELHAQGRPASSPVDSCDPFTPRAALITSSEGIAIPDPESAEAIGYAPAGWREDLQRRDWTLECQVKLLATNLMGDLFCFRTRDGGGAAVTVYQLSLSNNVPVLSFSSPGTLPIVYTVKANALPTNRWIHLAAVWDSQNSSAGLYIQGVLYAAQAQRAVSASERMFPATNALALAVSPDGSFVNHLVIDEVRIWGSARTQGQLAQFVRQLVPRSNGDDVWLDADQQAGTGEYYGNVDSVIVNGGSLFEGESGVTLSNVCRSADKQNLWIDNGDRQYNAARDVLLMRSSTLLEGLAGTLISNVRWNDKDGDGKFSRYSLLAYYRFDDGGSTVEDFARRAKSGLRGATDKESPVEGQIREEYLFGDRGYALATNHFAWVTDDPAPVLGVDRRGADDSDGDGMPDAWEQVNGLDPWDDGSVNETAAGRKDGPNGSLGDPDGDGLVNIYEYWSDTNPRSEGSTGDWAYDAEEDRDGDGVENIVEQELGSRPDIIDTDDDGMADNEEAVAGTNPSESADPSVSRALVFGGDPDDYLDVPLALAQRLKDWTLEAWVMPTNAAGGAGTLVRRTVANLPGGNYAVNYMMGLEPDGSGGLRLYAGFVRPTGASYVVRGGGVSVSGVWTHVAASYRSTDRMLSLYTNGAMAATGAFTLVSGPPIDGPGGETFVRVGEDLAGGVDEVRIWSVVRTPAEIKANMAHVLSTEGNAGLVNYFRFDDGEANTNLFPWGEFHQPGGMQDFSFARDWTQQWRHSARVHGHAASVEPGAIVSPPSVRVMLAPDVARLAGAQWCLDGGAWQDSGNSLQGLEPGAHTILYKSIAGWHEPASESVTLTNGIAVMLTRWYEEKAKLSVSIEPATVRSLGAAWRVDNGAWQSSGAEVAELDPGVHDVSFLPVVGWAEPLQETVSLAAGQVLTKVFAYTNILGAVTVALRPSEAVVAGAQWRLNGGTWMESGTTVSNLQLGTYSIGFRGIPQWIEPAALSVAVSNRSPVVVTGDYAHATALGVTILPDEALAAGAQWRLAGGGWLDSGSSLDLAPGSYTVQFKAAEGWLPPGDILTTVVTQQLTSLQGTYLRAEVFGGTASTNAGQFLQPRGVAVDARHRLYVSDTFNHRVQMYDPYDQSWTVWGGQGTNAGQFNKPGGVAVDAAGNVYVADSNNHRVQRRAASNGQWRVYGRYGAAVGLFNAPLDVSVDSRTNLYVADAGNSRIQKMTPAGVWSVFIPSSLVSTPNGLLIDAVNNVYVSEGVQGRVQLFGSNGQFKALIGSSVATEGGLNYPGGLAVGGTNLYVADIGASRVACVALTNKTWTTLLGNNTVSRPEDVAWDPRGILYIADTMHDRILGLPVTAEATNALPTLVSMAPLAGGRTGFVVSWYGRRNWYYAVQYSRGLGTADAWSTLPACTNIPGCDAMTNCVDQTVDGTKSRFYRVWGY